MNVHNEITQEGPSMAPRLEVSKGDNIGERYKVKMLTRIGRELDNDIILTDLKSSRHHAEVTYEGGRWVLTDLGSYNKTYLNGAELHGPTILQGGDRITIGQMELTFLLPQAAANDSATVPTRATVPPRPQSIPPAQPASAPATTPKKQGTSSMFWSLIAVLLVLAAITAAMFYVILSRPDNDIAVSPTIAPPGDNTGANENETDAPTELPVADLPLELTYEEDFSDSSSGWDDSFDDYTRKVYGNNRYQVEVRTPNLVAWGMANRDVADFEIEVEARREEGDVQNSFGLLFRFKDRENFYRFDITDDGYYLLSKFADGTWTTLADWSPSPLINQGGENTIKVRAFGPEIEAWINGEQVAAVTDSSIDRGNFGFFASTFNEPYAWVSFDNLTLNIPEGKADEIVLVPTATRPFAVLIEDTPTPATSATPTRVLDAEETAEPVAEGTDVASAADTDDVGAEGTAEAITDTASIEIEIEATEATIEATPEPTSAPLPEYVSRDQPLGRGQASITGRIVFPIFNSGTGMYDIYIADAADGGNRRLIQQNASQPDVSEDGQDLTYRSWQPDQRGLFARPFGGGDAWHFSKFVEDSGPQFSPTSKTLMFFSRVGGKAPALYKVIDGVSDVLRYDSVPIQGSSPKWLTGEGQIIFQGCEGSSCGLMISNSDGGGRVLLTQDASDYRPEVSPDGSAIAFMSQREGNWDIFTRPLDGGDLVQLTTDDANDGLPTWSPDGSYIAFVSAREGEWALWSMAPDGSSKRRLFVLEGSIDGVITHDVVNSKGWIEENIDWIGPEE